MIFTRIAIAGLVVAVVVAALGSGGPDPAVALEARRLAVARAMEADIALAELEDALAPALAAGREGAARTAAGDELPGAAFHEAAGALDMAVAPAERADRAIRALGAARVAGAPDAPPISASPSPAELAAISAELRALAASADGFVDLRRRAEGLSALLAEAIARTAAGDLAAAEGAVEAARADFTIIEAWDSGLDALPVWLETTGEMLGATESLVAAARDGDEAAARAAGDRVAALDEDAVFADRALRIAMSEGAAFATEGPLAALAEAERRTIGTHEQVASILQAHGR